MSIDLVSKYFRENKSLFQISKLLNLPLGAVRDLANASKVIGHRVEEFCRAQRGKRIVLFDLETTGLPRTQGFNKYYPYTKNQYYDSARIVQLSYCQFVLGESEPDLKNYFRRPDGFHVSTEAFNVHGITQTHLETHGVAMESILDSGFIQALNDCDWIISHNIKFDFNILCNEMYRLNRHIPVEWFEKLGCTCQMTDYTKLGVLYTTLVGDSSDLNFHDARTDVLALYRILSTQVKNNTVQSL